MRIGIIGTGRIAKRFVPEAEAVDGVEIAAVYNPHEGSARKFWANFSDRQYRPTLTEQIGKLWELVDAVYIASPHETHFEYIIQALHHGKHVLCEKPIALDGWQIKECIKIADEYNLILMEGLKTAYCPGYSELIKIAESGIIGEIKYIDSCFTKLENENNRELTNKEYGGSLTELGSYVLLPIIDLFGCDYTSINVDSVSNELGLDVFTKVDLDYHERMATAKCGLGVKCEGSLIVSGTKGYIKADAPWWKTAHIEVHYEDSTKKESFNYPFEGDGLRYEIKEFLRRINADEVDSDVIKAERSRFFCVTGIMEQRNI